MKTDTYYLKINGFETGGEEVCYSVAQLQGVPEKLFFFEDFKIYICLILGESVFVLAFRGFPSVPVCLRRARLHSSKLRNRYFEIVFWILNLYFCRANNILGFH